MKLLKLAFKQLTERKGIVLLMITELTVALITINIFTSQFANLFALNDMYKTINAEKIWASNQLTLENSVEDITALNLPDGVTQIKNCGEVVILPKGEIHKTDNNNPVIYLWPKEYYEKLNFKLSNGSLMREPKNDCLNIVVPKGLENRYKVGNTYEAMVWYNTHLDRGESVTINLYVCGTLENAMMLKSDGSPSYDNLGIFGLNLTNVLTNIPNEEPSYFFFAESVLNEEDSKAMSVFSSHLNKTAENQQETILLQLRIPIVIAIATLCFCLSAFLGYNIINLIDKEKRTAIYFMCGAKTRDIIKIKLYHDMLLISIPLILSFIGILGIYRMGLIVNISWYGVATSYLCIFLIFALSSLIFIQKLNKRSIVSYIHKWL